MMNADSPSHKLLAYAQLMRLNRPIGIYLLLWPTLWALWIAAQGMPDIHLLLIFSGGVILMRSAGCVINDYADRHVDGSVKRTQHRPLVTGQVKPKEALILFALLCLMAFGLVLLTDMITVLWSVGGLALATTYPFMKRYTYLPQVVLGAAFAWAIPMAFSAQMGFMPPIAWVLYTVVVIWTIAYDTMYAMVDRDDDIKIGVKSTAILFADYDKGIIGLLQAFTIIGLILIGHHESLGFTYYTSLAVVAILFLYQQKLIYYRDRKGCFQAFLNNHWVGMVIFLGLFIDSLLSP